MIWHPWPEIHDRLRPILLSWKGTPYLEGSKCKGGGTDCVRFCCGVVDELFGYSRCPTSHLPADVAFHSPDTAFEAMRALRRLYDPLLTVNPTEVQPGDLVVTGPAKGGPGHLMIVGPKRNTLWHQTKTKSGVVMTGFAPPEGFKVFRIYRFADREQWVLPS